MMTTRGRSGVVPPSDARLIAQAGTRGKTISIMRSGMSKRKVGKEISILQSGSFQELQSLASRKCKDIALLLLQQGDTITVVIHR